jgi:cephalosporin hydroxylase
MPLFKKAKKKYRVGEPNSNCSEPETDKWVISDFVVSNLIPEVGTRPFPLDELMLMVSAVVYFKPEVIFEWGTHVGKSARVFYETIKAFDIPCNIHSVDLPPDALHTEHPKEKHGMLVKNIKEVHLHRGDGVLKSLEIYKSMGTSKKTLFLIDGDHSYESVLRELTMVVNEVKDPVILLHDTFYQSPESKYNIGPYKAIVDCFKGKQGDYKIISTQMGLPGMTLVYKK